MKNLSVEFQPDKNTHLKAVENVSFSLHEGELLGLVGESGCGKTTMMLSLLRLLPEAGRITSGKILYRNQDLLDLEENQMRDLPLEGDRDHLPGSNERAQPCAYGA